MKAKEILINKINELQQRVDILKKQRDDYIQKKNDVQVNIDSVQAEISDIKADKDKL